MNCRHGFYNYFLYCYIIFVFSYFLEITIQLYINFSLNVFGLLSDGNGAAMCVCRVKVNTGRLFINVQARNYYMYSERRCPERSNKTGNRTNVYLSYLLSLFYYIHIMVFFFWFFTRSYRLRGEIHLPSNCKR